MISVTITGNLGRDGETRQAGASPVVSFSVASKCRKKEGGQWVDGTDWCDVSYFGDRAAKVAQYLTKGKTVCVRGVLTTRTYEAKDGTTKTVLDVKADDVELLGGKGDRDAGRDEAQRYGTSGHGASAKHAGTPEGADDIPF